MVSERQEPQFRLRRLTAAHSQGFSERVLEGTFPVISPIRAVEIVVCSDRSHESKCSVVVPLARGLQVQAHRGPWILLSVLLVADNRIPFKSISYLQQLGAVPMGLANGYRGSKSLTVWSAGPKVGGSMKNRWLGAGLLAALALPAYGQEKE